MLRQTHSTRSSFLIGTAFLLYAYWALDFMSVEPPWICLAAVPALIPVRRFTVALIAAIVTLVGVGILFFSSAANAFGEFAVAATCATIPLIMLAQAMRGRLVSPWFARSTPGTRGYPWVATLRGTCIALAIVLLMPLVSRDFNIEMVLPIAIALLITARALPSPTQRTKTARGYLINTVVVCVSIALSLALIEIGARVFVHSLSPQVGLFYPDAKAFFRLRPSSTGRMRHPTDNGTVREIRADTSDQGLRDRHFGPKTADEYRILLLGDSFTFGQTVDFPDTIGHRLEWLFEKSPLARKITVMNLGIPATAPWQQQIYLEDIGFDLQPDLVIHQLFLGNDLHDTLSRTGKRLRIFDSEWEYERQRLRLRTTLRFEAEQWLADHSHAYSVFRESVGRGAVTRFLMHQCRLLPKLDIEIIDPSPLIPPSWEVNTAEWYPEIEEAMSRLIATVCATRAECDARGIGYVLYIAPIAEEVVPWWYQEARERYRIPERYQYEMGKGQRHLDAELAKHRVPNIPVPDCLRGNPDPETLYLKLDGHMTEAGNAATAQCIYDYLLDAYFPAYPIDKPRHPSAATPHTPAKP